jgi:hypothetical protein
MEVRLHFVMFEELNESATYARPYSDCSEALAGEPGTVARICMVRGVDPGDVDFEFDEGL